MCGIALTWTPSGGKEKDIKANKCDLASDGRPVVRLRYSTGSDTDDTNDELADHHTRGTPDHNCTTAPFLNDIEGNRSGADVDKGRDKTNEEGVRDCAELLEKGGAEVEDKVDTSPLLHHLKGNTKDGSAEVGRWVGETAGKASKPRAKVAGLRNDRHLILVVGDDFGQFLLDVLRSFWLTTELGQDVDCLVEVSLLDKVTRRLGEQEETGSKNDSPQHLEGHWDTVGAGIESVLGAIVDARSEQDTDCNAELVSRHEGSTNLFWRNLRHVQDDDSRDESNTKTSNETTGYEEAESRRSCLENNTDNEDEASNDDGGSSTKPISEITGNQGTKEGTARENGGDERLLPGRESESVELVCGCIGRRVWKTLIEVDEVIHGQHTGNVTRVETEEDTTE